MGIICCDGTPFLPTFLLAMLLLLLSSLSSFVVWVALSLSCSRILPSVSGWRGVGLFFDRRGCGRVTFSTHMKSQKFSSTLCTRIYRGAYISRVLFYLVPSVVLVFFEAGFRQEAARNRKHTTVLRSICHDFLSCLFTYNVIWCVMNYRHCFPFTPLVKIHRAHARMGVI